VNATRFPFRRCFVTYRHAKCEFIAAQASSDVIRSNSRDERLSYDAKHLVACSMPVLIIHRLEVVEVDYAAQKYAIIA